MGHGKSGFDRYVAISKLLAGKGWSYVGLAHGKDKWESLQASLEPAPDSAFCVEAGMCTPTVMLLKLCKIIFPNILLDTLSECIRTFLRQLTVDERDVVRCHLLRWLAMAAWHIAHREYWPRWYATTFASSPTPVKQ